MDFTRYWYRSITKSISFLLLSLLFTQAFGSEVLIVSSSTSKVYTRVANSLEEAFEAQCRKSSSQKCTSTEFTFIQQDQLSEKIANGTDYLLLVTLGRSAAKEVIRSDLATPRIYALIPKNTYETQLQDKSHINHSAVFLDQPFSRHLRLSKIIKANPRLGILLSDSTALRQAEFAREAKALDIDIYFRKIKKPSNLGFDLKKLMYKANLLLALPDASIYNKKTIFNILLSSYHNHIPLIGFSSAYVKAGALAAIHSSPQQIGKHLSELTFDFVTTANTVLPKLNHAKYFGVSINSGVANSLDISLPSEAHIIDLIMEAEK